MRANQRRSIHHTSEVLQPLRNLDIIDRRIDRWECAHHLLDRQPNFERLIALRIKRLRRRIPPPIHKRMHESAFALGWMIVVSASARSKRGSPAMSAAALAAAIARKKSRRVSRWFSFSLPLI